VVARLFEPTRLTLARELRKCTKAELASRVGKTPSAVSQFESGRIRPDGATVAALALALDVPVVFFTFSVPAGVMSVDECHFRSLRSASQRDRRSLLARGTLLCDLADQLEDYVEIPTERVPRIDREVETKEDIERVADEVRRHWGLGLGPISNVVWLLERNGIIVSYIPSDCAEADAFSGWRRTRKHVRPFIFLTDLKGAPCRSRFDAAHELGHLVMHVDAHPGSPDLEQQANQFASALLMPREAFGREAPRWLHWDLIWELKRRWRVSARAILFRAHDLGLLSDASYRRGFVYLNQQFSEGEPHEPEREQPLLLREALRVAKDDVDLGLLAERIGFRAHHLAELVQAAS
jgi:Zn-dependent peptidase ImmA (M78 family)/DNA-binding XRE family transcriptional regulator